MNVQGLRLETGEAIRNRDEPVAQTSQILQSLVQAEILHPVDTHFDPQEGAELFVHPAHEVLAVDAQHVMAMIEFFEHAVQLAVTVW